MALTRWLRISQGFAASGYPTDMIINTSEGLVEKGPNLRFVPYSRVKWSDYDVIKTLFHKGFESLYGTGGATHPFIVSKLGSVAGARDLEGVYFIGDERAELYEVQKKIAQASRYVTLLTEESRALWQAEHGRGDNVLLIPTGVDAVVPPPRNNPYQGIEKKIVVYIGNIYSEYQKEINLVWQERLNRLGAVLKRNDCQLCFVGTGDTENIDPHLVVCFKDIDNDLIWDYQYFADVGIVLGQGRVQHNESSKIYYYLRTGLPVVSEDGIPNNRLITESGMGLICEFGDDERMAEAILRAMRLTWPKTQGISYILQNHTWDHRVAAYRKLFSRELGAAAAGPAPPRLSDMRSA